MNIFGDKASGKGFSVYQRVIYTPTNGRGE